MALGILVVSGLAMSLEAQNAATRNTVVVTIVNYAGVAAKTLALAEEQASMIFQAAGVEIRWQEIPLTAEGKVLPLADQPAVRPVACVKLLTDSQIRKVRSTAGGFGYTIIDQIYVHMDRLLIETAQQMCPFHILLGYVIAHEIGHVFLGPDSHTYNSVMAPKLGDRQFRQMQMGGLLFCSKHVKQIHEFISVQEPVQVAANVAKP